MVFWVNMTTIHHGRSFDYVLSRINISDRNTGAGHTGESPFINQPFDIIQKFFDRNGPYTLRIRKIRKIRKM